MTDYRKCNACGLSNLATESSCFRCGNSLASERQAEPARTQLGMPPAVWPVAEDRPAPFAACPSCGARMMAGVSRCQSCGGDLVPANSAGFYQARLVPDSDFRRAQLAAGETDPDPAVKNSKVTVFAVLNFVLSVVALAGIGFWLLVAFTAIFQGDPKVGSVVGGSAMFIVPNVVCFLVFLPAAIGLMRRKNWGYYFHLTAAILAGFSCVGLVYTIPALIFAFQPDFKRDFPEAQG